MPRPDTSSSRLTAQASCGSLALETHHKRLFIIGCLWVWGYRAQDLRGT